MTNTPDKPRIVKAKRDPTRSVLSALDSLIEAYPDRAERKLKKIRERQAKERPQPA